MTRTIIGLLVLLFASGCDLCRTTEGLGVIGPNGGWFVCYDNDDCRGE